MTRPLRTALVGFGRMAAGYATDARMRAYFSYASHAQVLRDHPGFDWVAVVDVSAAARAAAINDWGVPVAVATVEELPAKLDVEVAVLAIPPADRAAAVARLPALRAVLVEKPLVGPDEIGDGAAFVAWCRESRLPVQVNYWRRAAVSFQTLAAGGLTKRIGPAQAGFAIYGNGLFNNGGHVVDFVRMLVGEPVAVSALGEPKPLAGAPLAGDVCLSFALHLASGATVSVQSIDFRHYREVGLDLWGERGRLSLYQEGLGFLHYPVVPNRALEDANEVASDQPEVLPAEVGDALYRLYDNLAAVVSGHVQLWSPMASALRAEQILRVALVSASRNGMRLTVPETGQ